jgi:glycosyltransferase involved in cell wall biosynthesis
VNRVYVLPPYESWIVDRFVKEWNEDNNDISVFTPGTADVIWLMADWCWQNLAQAGMLRGKKVITTVHHIVPEKFGPRERMDFQLRDDVTMIYHVYNQRCYDFIKPLTSKPIHLIPYWANQNIWHSTGSREELRKKHQLPIDAYLIGSFQRDTEGHDLKSPKLEKGPDLLADAIIGFRDKGADNLNVEVVLAGWRRQYVMKRLAAAGIRYHYFERPKQFIVNELYQCLDLYPVTARTEGGPQSLIECGLLNVPVVSRPVGIAEQVLPASAINDNVLLATPAVPNVDALRLPGGYEPYRRLIESL